MAINGKWFYKAPGVTCIDLMPAFFDKKVPDDTDLKLLIFAPPATGENVPESGDDWKLNYRYTLTKLPRIRIKYAPILP